MTRPVFLWISRIWTIDPNPPTAREMLRWWKFKSTQGLCVRAGRSSQISRHFQFCPFCCRNCRPCEPIRTWMFASKRYVLPLNELVVSAGNCFTINTNLVGNLGLSMCLRFKWDCKHWSNAVSTWCQPFSELANLTQVAKNLFDLKNPSRIRLPCDDLRSGWCD